MMKKNIRVPNLKPKRLSPTPMTLIAPTDLTISLISMTYPWKINTSLELHLVLKPLSNLVTTYYGIQVFLLLNMEPMIHMTMIPMYLPLTKAYLTFLMALP